MGAILHGVAPATRPGLRASGLLLEDSTGAGKRRRALLRWETRAHLGRKERSNLLEVF